MLVADVRLFRLHDAGLGVGGVGGCDLCGCLAMVDDGVGAGGSWELCHVLRHRDGWRSDGLAMIPNEGVVNVEHCHETGNVDGGLLLCLHLSFGGAGSGHQGDGHQKGDGHCGMGDGMAR